jgi:hypothetical protein
MKGTQMKNAILYRINSLIAYATVYVIFGYFVAERLLELQSKINDYFDYDWNAAVDERKSR